MMIPVVTSRVMEFTWLPPAPTVRNGRITSYNLTCFITGTGGMGRIGDIYMPQESYRLSGFRPARSYTCQVVAMNGAGSGPPAETTAHAPEDGKHCHITECNIIFHCGTEGLFGGCAL